jgi:hypothetical protein
MTSIQRLSSLVAFLLLCLAASAQQKVLIPEKIERPTVVDDKGVTQWAEHKADQCPACVGKGKVKCTTCERYPDEVTQCLDCKRADPREAVCRMCAGEGTLPDPLEKASCPACSGASFLLCTVCAGSGGMFIGGAKQRSKCPACSGDGGFKCTACDGKRLVEGASLKPSLKEAKDKDLTKAIAATDAAIEQLSKFEPTGGQKSRKDMKAFVKILESVQATYPPIKRSVKPLDDFMSKMYAGSQFQGSDENEAATMKNMAERVSYYLKIEKRMLQLAQKRNEANAQAATGGAEGEKAGKDEKGGKGK